MDYAMSVCDIFLTELSCNRKGKHENKKKPKRMRKLLSRLWGNKRNTQTQKLTTKIKSNPKKCKIYSMDRDECAR